MKKIKKLLVVGLIILLATASVVGCSQSSSPTTGSQAGTQGTTVKELKYPERPIELIIPFGEGGASDIFARKFAEIMSKELPVPIQPVNLAGSGGLVGMLNAAQQKNDGYTILSVTPSHIISDALETSPEVKLMRDFEPLVRIQSDIYILAVPNSSRFNSFEEIVEYGQSNPVTFAGISPGGLDELTLSALADATGIQLRFIPYGSGSEVKAAVLGGEVDLYLDKAISSINYIKEGAVKPVVVLNDERVTKVEQLKDVPSTVELGYDVTIGSWRGFVVKKGTPQEVKDYLIKVMENAYNTTEYQEFAAQSMVDIREGFLNPEDFYKDWEKELEIFSTIAEDLGLK